MFQRNHGDLIPLSAMQDDRLQPFMREETKMSIISKRPEREFEPAPPGLHQAVCVDVIDLGIVESQWGPQRKVSIRWQVAEEMADGRRYLVSKRYRNSLHPKAALCQDLEAWRGRAFTDEEAAGFDLERLIGANAMINVMLEISKDNTAWAAVKSVSPPLRTLPKLEPKGYTREVDRNPQTAQGAPVGFPVAPAVPVAPVVPVAVPAFDDVPF